LLLPEHLHIKQLLSRKPTVPSFAASRQRWLLLLLTACTLFVLLGSCALHEPDEGRYSEIAREMIETSDWLVGVSLKLFDQNEWAVHLPVALAGISGVWAAFG
jgi:4-amino-4-deoxy-L-arabinose transferase-like glycosyltransferase